MNKQFLIRLFYFLAIALFTINCSDDETSLNITDITVNVEKTTILLSQTATFSAVNQDGVDITNEVTFSIDGDEILGNTYTPTELGNFNVVATYQSIKSSVLVLTVIKNITSIVISADKTSIKPIISDIATLSAVNQQGEDITDAVDFYLNGTIYEQNTFGVDELGNFDFVAKFMEVESNSINVVSELNVTELTLTATIPTFPANGNSSPTFIVRDQDLDTITNFTSIYHNGVELNDKSFQADVVGMYDFTAKYENVESNTLTLEAVEQRSNRKVLVEEFTGEWCGWCPQAAYNLDLLVHNNSKVLTVGIHNGDGLEYDNEGIIRGEFGLNYFPSGLVGRVNLGDQIGYNGPVLDTRVTDEIDRQLNEEEVLAGISINSSVNGGNATVSVDVEFYNTISEEVAVTIYIIENDVVGGSQQNYFPGTAGYESAYYYSQPSVIDNFVHQYVLRKVATDVYGDAIPSSETVYDNTYSHGQKLVDITGYNSDKCYVIAFVHYALDGDKKSIINAQQVKLGSDIGFEE